MRDPRIRLVGGIVVGAILALALYGPIPQDQRFHDFADSRTIAGIPNFWNVVSNLPFLLAGAWGLFRLVRRRPAPTELRPAFAALFTAFALVAFGATWDHLDPRDASLFWDRLPMTLGFGAFLAVVVGERVSPRAGRMMLVPLLAVGLASVLVWRATGDLRLYVLVQYVLAGVVPLVLLLYRGRPGSPTRFYLGAIGAYAFATVLEVLDRPIYQALGVSGHTLKHHAAAGGTCLLVLAATETRPASGAAP